MMSGSSRRSRGADRLYKRLSRTAGFFHCPGATLRPEPAAGRGRFPAFRTVHEDAAAQAGRSRGRDSGAANLV